MDAMNKINLRFSSLKALLSSTDRSLLAALLVVIWRIVASLRCFSNRELTPSSFQQLELRLERLGRDLVRLLLEHALDRIESADRPNSVRFEHRDFHAHRCVSRTIETRLGTVCFRRWVMQNEYCFVKDIVPVDLRLGLIGDRVSPALAHKLGRLAADLPQQMAIEQLAEQFNVRLSVEAYRGTVERLSYEVRYLHDDVAIEQLTQWIEKAANSKGKHEVLLMVGRDGVHVPMRPLWKEAGCATLAVYDRNRKRLGTIYLGEMPQKNQVVLTKRLTTVIQGTLRASKEKALKLRYVTDAGSLPRSYFRKILSKMKHPVTGESLRWSWGVDFYHACEYLSKLSESLFGFGTPENQTWFKVQRHALRHDKKGIQRVLSRAAQQKRRHGLKGSEENYRNATGYLSRYRSHMDYAERRSSGDPIGSGITEAGCKVIFNQRLKQSGMRWSKTGGQWIVDLRTACRSGLWEQIWNRVVQPHAQISEINEPKRSPHLAAA